MKVGRRKQLSLIRADQQKGEPSHIVHTNSRHMKEHLPITRQDNVKLSKTYATGRPKILYSLSEIYQEGKDFWTL